MYRKKSQSWLLRQFRTGASTRQEEAKIPRQTNPGPNRSAVASANKKVLNSQNPTLLSESDKKKLYIHETFDCTKNELTIEGSCGAAHRLEQFRQGPVKTISGWTALDVDLDHHLSSRSCQGVNQNFEREVDTNIVEADLHKLLSTAGPDIYRLQKEKVSIDDYSLITRIDVLKLKPSFCLQNERKEKDYIDCSERASALNASRRNSSWQFY